MSASPSIRRESASYSRGLILGLTMAEALLLLVFCLMLGLITYLQKAQNQRDAARSQVNVLEQSLESAQRKFEDLARRAAQKAPELVVNPAIIDNLLTMAGSVESGKLDETWRRIVRNDETVQSLMAKGLNVANLSDAQIDQLKRPVQDSTKTAEALKKAEALDGILAEVSKRTGIQMRVSDIAESAVAGNKSGGHKWPPIINLSEAGGYSFAVGSAALTPQFRDKIKGAVIDRLIDIASRYDVDIIEVVGHTDEQPINPRPSNLDRDLPKVIQGEASIERLVPGDNAGLGLARAVSVMSVLLADARLSKLSILPLSGAQLVNIDETLARRQGGADAKERRRIEIRLRKSSSAR